MDSIDSPPLASCEASTDEPAAPSPAELPPAASMPAADELDRPFATAAEREAYWIGVRAGAESARAGSAPADGRHRPAELDFELTRDPQSTALVSTRLTDATVAPPLPGRALRHDGWTPEKEQVFFRALASTGVVADACRACGMSRDAAYSRRNCATGRAFALAWDAALVLARPAMADDVQSRARHGVIDKIYRNGELVAERHRHDNRLAMAVLTRLDQLVERLGERAPAVEAVARNFDRFLDLLPGGDEAADGFLESRLAGAREVSAEPAAVDLSAARYGTRLRREGVDDDDLDVDEMESWTDDQMRRAELSGLVDCLHDELWPDAALDGEADGTDGMCKLRKLYLRARCNNRGEDYWEEEPE